MNIRSTTSTATTAVMDWDDYFTEAKLSPELSEVIYAIQSRNDLDAEWRAALD
jgi:hypothetical protein